MATTAARRWELSSASFGRVSRPGAGSMNASSGGLDGWHTHTVCARAPLRGSHGIRAATLACANGESFHTRPSLAPATVLELATPGRLEWPDAERPAGAW